jgi:hypothetical protein
MIWSNPIHPPTRGIPLQGKANTATINGSLWLHCMPRMIPKTASIPKMNIDPYPASTRWAASPMGRTQLPGGRSDVSRLKSYSCQPTHAVAPNEPISDVPIILQATWHGLAFRVGFTVRFMLFLHNVQCASAGAVVAVDGAELMGLCPSDGTTCSASWCFK